MHGLMQDDYPLTVQHILRRARTVNGHREVVTATGDGGVRRLTYRDMVARIDRLCAGLQDLGVVPGDRVATLAWNTSEHMEAYLGVPAMGAVLHTLNHRLHPDQLVYILQHGGARVLIADGSLLPVVEALLPRVTNLTHLVLIGKDRPDLPGVTVLTYEDLLDLATVDPAYPEIDDRAAAGLCYTSGTTGNPRGVLYSHRSTVLHALGLCLSDALGISSRDRVLAVVPMFHANGWGLGHAAALVGADLVLPGRWLGPRAVSELLECERVTVSGAVPTVWQDLVRFARDHQVDLSALERVSCGGAAVPRSLLEAFDTLGVTMLHAWGMTEISPLGSVAVPPPGATDEETWDYRLSQGRLMPLLEARLLGADGDVPFDGRSSGELLVRGPWVASSYFDDPASDRFVEGWLRTGDVATISPEGYLRLVDRAKDLIKSGGEWISSVALENLLMDHPAIEEACVVARPDVRWTERPVAYVVVEIGSEFDPRQLGEYLEGKVAPWWIPDEFVAVSELPKTSVGKLDKKKLRARFAETDLATAESRTTGGI